MFAKVILFCAVLAAVHATLLAPIGHGAPFLAAGHLGYGKGLISSPAVAAVSSQKAVINHVAPAAHVSVAPASIALASHGILNNRLVGGHGISATPLTVGSGIYGVPVALGVRNHGLGHGAIVSSQKTAINHVAPAAPIDVSAPHVLTNHGIYGNGIVSRNHLLDNGFVRGHGLSTAHLAIGNGLLGAPIALGHGAAVSSQKSVISHVAPAAPHVALANHGLLRSGIVGGHGIAAAPLAINNGLFRAPISLGHGAAISSQKSVISHVAPAAHVAAPHVAFANHDVLRSGIVGGHGIAAAPFAINNGLLGSPISLGHGATVSSQKSVISHVAPAAHVAAPHVTLANHGLLRSELIGGHGLGIAGHGISALPLSISNGIHGAPIAHGLRKVIL